MANSIEDSIVRLLVEIANLLSGPEPQALVANTVAFETPGNLPGRAT